MPKRSVTGKFASVIFLYEFSLHFPSAGDTQNRIC